ncbi:MAG: hypothetical protein LC804_05810 [Acidobacteria bacterium]|nr:hypothetical protein [Acidobacteriota bacterium]
MSLRLLESLATTEALAEAFSDAALLASMLRFEVALARAEARAGVITDAVADAIAAAAIPDGFDVGAIARDARASGTITIPLVAMLTVRVQTTDPAAATFVHWGATSQDVSDTALVLCLRRAFQILTADHDRLTRALRRLSDQHAGTEMLARTLLQPAPPTTFGLKAAGWFGAVSRSYAHLATAFKEACVLQFGGASGTLAALGPHGMTALLSGMPQEHERGVGGWHAEATTIAALVQATARRLPRWRRS